MLILAGEKITKRYGDVQALNGLDIKLNEGEVYGFLGRNGAGKSTALQIIMGITLANSGNISLFGKILKGDDPSLRCQIGYVAQEQHFYQWMSPKRLGRFVAGFYPTWDDAEYQRLLKLLEVPFERKILGFSGGMRAKLALSLALAHHPRLLLLDEPTAGMDPVARREFIDIVRDQAVRSQRSTLFSSHLIDEVERAADKVGIIDQGKMCYEGSLVELHHCVKRLIVNPDVPEQSCTELDNYLKTSTCKILCDEIKNEQREITIQAPSELKISTLNLPELIQIEQLTLEDIFVAMVSHKVAL